MKIILDAMGGDLAPEAAVLGALEAHRDFGTEITLVGRGEEILGVMRKHQIQDLPKDWRSPMQTMWWTCTMTPLPWSTSGRVPP